MSDTFVLRNQTGEFLTKSGEWVASGDSKSLMRSPHRDDMLNEKVELTVKNPLLRIQIVSVKQQTNGRLELNGEPLLAARSDANECFEFAESLANPSTESTDN